jgi:aryl-alcohol dehydrogenase-like predicted oxidoreductase
MEDLKKNDCEIHTRSTFLQGLFFMNPRDLSHHFSDAIPFISKLQEQFQSNLAGALLKYVLSFDLIDKVILGVQNSQQLLHNIESLESAKELKHFSVKISDSILQPSKWKF